MSNNQDYVPTADAQFSIWSDVLVKTVGADGPAYGLTAEEITELSKLQSDWTRKFEQLQPRRDAARAATIEKDGARKSFESYLRKISQKIQNNPDVSNGQRSTAGLPIHSTSRTPVAVPTTAPIAAIETNNVREHFLRFSDSNNPYSRVRPKGVFGVEIWICCGEEAPVDDGQFKMYTTATRMSATVAFNAEQAGKTVWYQFRYLNTRGEVGPWSMVYTSTVTR